MKTSALQTIQNTSSSDSISLHHEELDIKTITFENETECSQFDER